MDERLYSWPQLIADVKRLEAENAELREQLERLRHDTLALNDLRRDQKREVE